MENIIEVASATGNLKKFIKTVQAAGLVDTLTSDNRFTVLAPNDEAFQKLQKETIDDLFTDIPKLTTLVMHHILSGKILAADIAKLKSVKTLQGQEVKVDASR